MPVLEVRGLSMRFEGVHALEGVSLRVEELEIVGLIGPNGAGKTTVFDCVTGVHRPQEGRVRFAGHDLAGLAPHERSALGIGRTFQNLGLVPDVSVLDNLLTAQHGAARYPALAGMLGAPSSWRAERRLRRRVEDLLGLLGLEDLRDRVVRTLPYGTRKRVEIAAALATDPELLMLDEPGSGLGPEEAERLGDALLALRRDLDVTMLMIEHHVPLVARICDYVYCLNFGRLVAEGRPATVRAHPQVVAAYLGLASPTAGHADRPRRRPGKPAQAGP